jgi:predicted methyltransferase
MKSQSAPRAIAFSLLLLMPSVSTSEPAQHLIDAVATADRPAADRLRDTHRKPAEVLAFFGIAPGMKVADLVAGSGYYTEILAAAVGPEGTVWAQNHRWVLERFGDEGISKRLAKPGLANAVRWDRELEELGLPEGELDAVVMVLFYHDTYWQGVDRAAMNAEVWRALEPGGVYGVIDHQAEAGSGDRDVKTIHRVDAELVKREILAAGFVLEAESDVLSHPEDDRTRNVFDESIRGRTDRFVYRFRKPADS